MQRTKIRKNSAILGTGLSGTHAFLNQVAQNKPLNLTLFYYDKNQNFLSNRSRKNFLKRGARKLNSHAINSYNLNSFSNFAIAKNVVFLPSKGLGGYSEIWGAVIDSPDKFFLSYNFQVKHNSNILDKKDQAFLTYLMNKTKETKNVKRLSHFLAFDEKKCISCGACHNLCPTDAIWKSSYSVMSVKSSLPSHIKVNEINCRIDNISVEKNFVEITDSNNEKYKFESVFLALGVQGNAGLLLNSATRNTFVELSDSQLILLPFINRFGGYRSKKFSLSVASYSIKIENFAEIKSQIYCDASYFHEAIIDRFQIFKIFPKKLLMLLLHRIGIAFLYMDSEDSNLIRGETTFHKNGSKEIVIKEISNPKLKHKWYLKNRISKIFNKSGLFTLPFFINFEKTGQAFHSTIIKTNSEFIIEDSSTLNNLQSRVSVSGLNLDNSYHNGSQASFLLSTNLF